METPKSSIITRHRSISTPRRPLATSTPLFTSNVASHLHSSANNSVHQRVLTPSNINTSTNTTTKDSVESKMNETIAAAISQQQVFQSKCRVSFFFYFINFAILLRRYSLKFLINKIKLFKLLMLLLCVKKN